MEVTAMELGKRKGKVFMSFVQIRTEIFSFEKFSLSHLKNHVGYCLVRRNQRKFSRYIKVLHSEECITQHK